MSRECQSIGSGNDRKHILIVSEVFGITFEKRFRDCFLAGLGERSYSWLCSAKGRIFACGDKDFFFLKCILFIIGSILMLEPFPICEKELLTLSWLDSTTCGVFPIKNYFIYNPNALLPKTVHKIRLHFIFNTNIIT